MADELTPESFAQTIKAKYPQYANVPDLELTNKILEKYPAYREKFRQSTMLAGQKQVLDSEMEKANPGSQVSRDPQTGEVTMTQPGTAASRAREAAIGLLEPLSGQALLGTLQQGGEALWDALLGKPGKAVNMVKSAVTAPLEPVKELVGGVKSGNYETAAHGAGGFASQTAPAVLGLKDAAVAGANAAGLPDLTRRAGQTMASSSAFKTTEPLVDAYNADRAATGMKQIESDIAIADKNRQAGIEADQKFSDKMSDFEKAEAEKKAGFKEKAADTIKANREALQGESRNLAVNRSIEEGSKRLGEKVNDLDLKLREEANGKYNTVREAVKDDPGVPLSEMAQAAKEAQGKLSGSAESIKQFNELIRKGAEEGEVQAGGMTVKPGDRLYDMLKEQGAFGGDENIGFKDLQGYSSEIGRKLAQGNLPGDIYQALKYMKEKIDAAKTVIAERNNAGGALKNADSFWHDYQDLFYDKDSSIAKVRESVGVKNPGEASNEFFRGNANEIAIGKLKRLRSVYAPDANAVADLAQNLGAARDEASAYKVQRQQQMPNPPKPGERPTPVVTATTPRKVFNEPAPPTAENIVADKRARVEAKGRSLAEISKYDAGTLASAPIGVALGHPLLGLVPLASKYGLSFLLTRASVLDWLSKPTMADMLAIEKLPEPVKTTVRQGLQQVMDEESAGGRQVQPAGPVRNFMNRTTVVSGPMGAAGGAGIKSRRDALEALGQPTP
jgi:hypothetical protein